MAGGGIKQTNIMVRGGADGATYIPTVSEAGVISWENNKMLPNPPSVNIKGNDGKDGAYVTKISFSAILDSGAYQYKMTFSDGTAQYFEVPAIDYAVSALKLVDTDNKGLNIGDESTPVFFKDGVPVRATDVASGNAPIFIGKTLYFPSNTHEDIFVGQENGVDENSLNRAPNAGDKATGFCKTSDNYVYGFVCEFTGHSVTENNVTYYLFVFTSVELLREGIEYATQEDIPTQVSQLENDAQYTNKAYVDGKVETAESIAKGRATGYVFDTLADLEAWLEVAENTEKLVLGDNFYIRATDTPDYWWDGTQKQQLETQKVNLTEYTKNGGYIGTTADLSREIQDVDERLSDVEADYLPNGGYGGTAKDLSLAIGNQGTSIANIINGTTSVGDAKKLNGQSPSYYTDYANLTNKPTKLSDFENDEGFIADKDLTTETWTFTLADGTVLDKKVVLQ